MGNEMSHSEAAAATARSQSSSAKAQLEEQPPLLWRLTAVPRLDDKTAVNFKQCMQGKWSRATVVSHDWRSAVSADPMMHSYFALRSNRSCLTLSVYISSS